MAVVDFRVLDEMAWQGDPLGDQVVADHVEFREESGSADTVRQMSSRMHGLGDIGSPALDEYLAATPPLPAWTDAEKMARGAAFFASLAPEIGSALFCGSLPESYASPRGARVLTLTGRLTGDPVRRITETAQMLLDVMTVGGLEPGIGVGYQDARRVRLMHAAVRHHIATDEAIPHTAHLPVPGNGWCDGWGVPINQEDLLGALLTFTVTIFEVLEKLGVECDPADVDAYLHRWCVIGSLMGLREDVLPLTWEEAAAAADLIRRRQNDISRDGRELTRVLQETIEDSVPFAPVRGVIPATMRWYVGDEVSTILGIHGNGWSPVMSQVVSRVSEVMHLGARHNKHIRKLSHRLGALIVQSFMDANRSDGRPAFAMPEELRSSFPKRRARRFRL